MVGAITGGAGGGWKITVGANAVGGSVSAGLKGDDFLLGGGVSRVQTQPSRFFKFNQG